MENIGLHSALRNECRILSFGCMPPDSSLVFLQRFRLAADVARRCTIIDLRVVAVAAEAGDVPTRKDDALPRQVPALGGMPHSV